MGMYDNVKITTSCPVCKAAVSGFQSKDGDCLSHNLSFWEVDNFYSNCEGCGSFIEYTIAKYKRKLEDYDITVSLRPSKLSGINKPEITFLLKKIGGEETTK